MEWMTLAMILGAAGAAFWSASRAAAERATELGRDACKRAGVQLLDHSVHAERLRVRRRDDGRLGLEYSFRFYWSDDGVQRHVGRMVLQGEKLVGFSGPLPGTGTGV
ncbi:MULTISPECIES: DUF3301 domain-containing protein [unclassified Luteimonas]